MKENIKRSIRGIKLGRAAGDLPALDHVGRMPGLGMPKARRKRKKTRDSERFKRRKRAAFSWTGLLGLCALALLGGGAWAGFQWLRSQGKNAMPVDVAVSPSVIAPFPVRAGSGFPSPTESEAVEMVRSALSIRDPEKIPDAFRTGNSGILRIVDFLGDSEEKDGPVEHCEWLGNMDCNGLQVDGVMVYQKRKDGETGNRVALLTPDSRGRWLIDFEAYSRATSPSWPDILHQQAGVALVRVYVSRQNYYNGPFADEGLWRCHGLVSPDMGQTLMGYCRQGTPAAAAMNWLLSKDADSARATLEIRRVEGSGPRQFEVTAVVAEDWVVADGNFDDRFK